MLLLLRYPSSFKVFLFFPLNSDPAARLAEGGTEARALCERQRAARAAAGAGRGPAGADVHREGDCAEPFGVFMPWLDRIPVGSTGKAQRLQITLAIKQHYRGAVFALSVT